MVMNHELLGFKFDIDLKRLSLFTHEFSNLDIGKIYTKGIEFPILQ